MFQWVGKLFGGRREAVADVATARGGRRQTAQAQPPQMRPAGNRLRAYYEAAQTTDETSRLNQLADNLSAKAANNFAVRRQLRSWARYEVANGGFARGIVDTCVQDLIGVGPKPRVIIRDPNTGEPEASEARGREVERKFKGWFKAIAGLDKLRTIAMAKKTDGEGFLVLTTYDRVEDPVKLYPRDIECDQITTPSNGYGQTLWVDGMVLDKLGQPVSYDMLRMHPGDYFYSNLNPWEFDRIPAKYVIQWFKKTRPGQLRGVPELTPALELFNRLRSYSKAVLGAAEIAADFAAVLETEAGANDDSTSAENNPGLLPFDQSPIDRQVMTALPGGAKLNQLKPQQPAQSYEMFQYCILCEACRAINIPLNVALGSSQRFNFSSARLDHLNYRAGLRVERRECEIVVLTRLFFAWLEEALLIPGHLPDGITADMVEVTWHWPGWADQDPLKDAQADTERLDNGTTTEAELAAEQGHDWEARMRQRVKEKALQQRLEKEAGLTTPAPPAPPAAAKKPAKASWARRLVKALTRLAGDRAELPDLVAAAVAREVRAVAAPPSVQAADPPPAAPSVVVNVPPMPIQVSVTNQQAAQDPPTVHVEAVASAPTVRVDAPVTVHVPEQPPAVVNVDVPTQPAPVVNVTTAAPGPREVIVRERDKDGNLKRAEVRDA